MDMNMNMVLGPIVLAVVANVSLLSLSLHLVPGVV